MVRLDCLANRAWESAFSASLELGLQAYATASGFFFFFNVHSVDQTQILSGKHFIS